jgi:hypothetical protein
MTRNKQGNVISKCIFLSEKLKGRGGAPNLQVVRKDDISVNIKKKAKRVYSLNRISLKLKLPYLFLIYNTLTDSSLDSFL